MKSQIVTKQGGGIEEERKGKGYEGRFEERKGKTRKERMKEGMEGKLERDEKK